MMASALTDQGAALRRIDLTVDLVRQCVELLVSQNE